MYPMLLKTNFKMLTYKRKRTTFLHFVKFCSELLPSFRSSVFRLYLPLNEKKNMSAILIYWQLNALHDQSWMKVTQAWFDTMDHILLLMLDNYITPCSSHLNTEHKRPFLIVQTSRVAAVGDNIAFVFHSFVFRSYSWQGFSCILAIIYNIFLLCMSIQYIGTKFEPPVLYFIYFTVILHISDIFYIFGMQKQLLLQLSS